MEILKQQSTVPDPSNPSDRTEGFSFVRCLIFLAGCAVSAWLLLTVPIDRNLPLIFRQKLYVLPPLFLLAFAAARARQPWIRIGLFWLMFIVFLTPLIGLWNSGGSDQYIFAGSIPFSDAYIHQTNTLRFLYGGTMGQSSAVRPLSLAVYALVLYLSGNNFYLLYALIAVTVALTTLAAFRLIARKYGSVAAAVFYLNAFFYVRRYLGTFLTEPFAFLIGMLALVLILIGLSEKRTGALIFGLSALSLALNVRPGAMTVLAAAGLWLYFVWLRQPETGGSWRERRRIAVAALCLIGMLLPFVLNEAVGASVYETGKPLTNNQAAEIIYGLCLGGKDAYHTMFLPELATSFGTDNATANLIDLCRTALRENPENLWLSVKMVWSLLLFDFERGFFSYFDGARREAVEAVRYLCLLFLAIGAAVFWRKRKDAASSFWVAVLIGLFLSRFILPPIVYKMRYDAATIMLTGFVLAVGVQSVMERVLARRTKGAEPVLNPSDRSAVVPAAVSIVLLTAVMIAAPLWIRACPETIAAKSGRLCDDGSEPRLTRIEPGNFIVLRNYELKRPHAPAYHLNYVRPRLHDTSAREMFAYTDQFSGEMTILSGLDLETLRDLTVFADWPLPVDSAGFVEVCGRTIDPPLYRQYTYVEAEEIFFVSEFTQSGE